MYRTIRIEKLKQTSNIWAMLAAAGFAAALFQKAWLIGCLFGAFSVFMSLNTIEKRVKIEKGVQDV